MEKNKKTEILKLELIRIKSIINEMVNSPNASLEKGDLLEYIDNLNRISIIINQVSKSVSVAKVRANNTLKNITTKQEKSYNLDDPGSIELQQKLDELYRLATQSKAPEEDSSQGNN